MELLAIVYRQYRLSFMIIMLLSLASAVVGIGVIAFINQQLIEASAAPWQVLPTFLGLVLLLLVVTLPVAYHLSYRGGYESLRARVEQ